MRRESVAGKAAAVGPDTTLPVALGAFFLFGLPDGLLGVAWPSMRADFQVGLAALGVPLLVLNGCYILTAALSGVLTNRLGAGRALAGALTLYLLGLTAVALAPTWLVLVMAMGLLGLSLGILDAGLNAYAALRHGSGVMNLLHGLYGVGTFVGPLAATAVLVAGRGWRPTYVAVGVVAVVVLIGIIATRRSWSERPTAARRASRPQESLWNRALLLSLVSFVCVVGLEASVGKWPFSVLIGSRHFSASTAGILVSLYWGGFTAGRLLAAATARFSTLGRLLTGSLTISLLGILLFWWNPAPVLGAAALPLIGVDFAALFPLLVALTPQRMASAKHAVGFQIAAGGVGAGAIPSLLGVLLAGVGLETLGPALLLVALVLIGCEFLAARAPRAAASR